MFFLLMNIRTSSSVVEFNFRKFLFELWPFCNFKSPLIVIRDSFSPWTSSLLPDGRRIACSGRCLYIFLIYCFYHLTCLYNTFYDLPALVGCGSSAFIRRIMYTFLNVCHFDYTDFAVSGKAEIP